MELTINYGYLECCLGGLGYTHLIRWQESIKNNYENLNSVKQIKILRHVYRKKKRI